MDILYEFHPFVFGGTLEKGRYCAALPLKTPPSSLLATHGRLFGMVFVRYPDVFPLEEMCREVLPYLERLYYERECHSPHGHLVAALTETQSFIEKRILEVNGVESVEFSVLVGCVWGSVLYVARCGGMCALRIYRDNSFGILFDTTTLSGSAGVVSLSGFIQPHDVIVLHDAAVQVSKFPLSAQSLVSLTPQAVYGKISQLFDIVSQVHIGESVSGFYIASTPVPSIEDEQIFFIDNSSDESFPSIVEPSKPSERVDLRIPEEPESPEVFQEVIDSPASVRNFGIRIRSHINFSHVSLFSRVKSVLAFFTKGRVFIIGCSFLLLFLGFIIIGKPYEHTFKQEKELVTQKAELIPQIREAYKQAQYYAELNPERAQTYLREAQGYLSQFGDAVRSDSEIAQLTQSVKEAYAIVTKTYILDSLLPFFDLKTINQNASGTKMAISASELLLSDTAQNSVYTVDFTSRAASAVIGREDITGLVSAEGDGKIVYAVGSNGIVRTDANSIKVIRLMGAGSEWGTIVDAQVFANSVYVLDTLRNQVWKYVPEGSGFGPVRNYISSDESVSLSNGVSLSIDGYVWVGMSDGSVLKFYSGLRDQFSLVSLEEPLTSLRALYTDEDSEYLYVLDSDKGRVVVFLKKDGSYVSTYQSDQFKGGADVVVDTSGNQMFVLRDNSIFRVELREKGKENE